MVNFEVLRKCCLCGWLLIPAFISFKTVIIDKTVDSLYSALTTTEGGVDQSPKQLDYKTQKHETIYKSTIGK